VAIAFIWSIRSYSDGRLGVLAEHSAIGSANTQYGVQGLRFTRGTKGAPLRAATDIRPDAPRMTPRYPTGDGARRSGRWLKLVPDYLEQEISPAMGSSRLTAGAVAKRIRAAPFKPVDRAPSIVATISET
jgi:hypothetical protein